MTPLTELKKLAELQAAATPGPWGKTSEDIGFSVRTNHTPGNGYVSEFICELSHYRHDRLSERLPNADFITAARNFDFAALDEKVRRLETALQNATGTLKYIETQAKANHPGALKVIEINAVGAQQIVKRALEGME